MCAFRIDKLRQDPAKILLLGRHAEQDAFGSDVLVESLNIGNPEALFDSPGGILIGSRMQSEGGFARHELAPGDSNFNFRPSTSRWNFTALSMSATNLITYLSCVPCI
jgi:hypothetical protein